MKYELIKEYPGSPKLGSVVGEIFLSSTVDKSTFPEFWKKVEEVDYEIIEHTISFDFLYPKSKINSVKRLSDGEVFTIGDEINFNEKIISISLIEGKIRVYPKNSFYYLLEVKKAKKTPLFTTEDGVDIFEGDSFCAVQKSTFDILKECRYKVDEAFITFSTPEKAEEYILLNKPCLSLMDLLSVRRNAGWTKPFPFFINLEELVKSKL